jgi:hypothetical protein
MLPEIQITLTSYGIVRQRTGGGTGTMRSSFSPPIGSTALPERSLDPANSPTDALWGGSGSGARYEGT